MLRVLPSRLAAVVVHVLCGFLPLVCSKHLYNMTELITASLRKYDNEPAQLTMLTSRRLSKQRIQCSCCNRTVAAHRPRLKLLDNTDTDEQPIVSTIYRLLYNKMTARKHIV